MTDNRMGGPAWVRGESLREQVGSAERREAWWKRSPGAGMLREAKRHPRVP